MLSIKSMLKEGHPTIGGLASVALFLASVCIFVVDASNAGAVTSSVIGPACSGSATTQKVSFVHSGDLHANFNLVDDKYSKIRAYAEKVRLENPYTIFTNSGDDFEKGSVAEQYSRGSAVTEATLAMQFDVRTIGNHDFAWGVERLLSFSRDPHSLVLSSNTHYDGADAQGLGSVDYGVLQVGCLKIGFFGLVGPSWNELDYETEVDYLPSLRTSFNYAAVAKSIVDEHRGDVDLMVMVSHLGNYWDKVIAVEVPGIDLVLGGHSHLPPTQETVSTTSPMQVIINNTLVVLPNFYGEGVTRVDMDVNLATHSVISSYQQKNITELTDIDSTVHQAISDILTKYASDAQQTIAYLENTQDNHGMASIAAKAAIKEFSADAALLDQDRADPYWTLSFGDVSKQDLINSYFVERQPSNTPGISALYMVEVSGESLQLMKGQHPEWAYAGPATPTAGSVYKVIVHKGVALNPASFFTGVNFRSGVTLLSETWEMLANYGAERTAACLSLDTDAKPQIPSCVHLGAYNAWTFSDSVNRLKTETGTATLGYWDPNRTGWGPGRTVFGSTSSFSLPLLADGSDSGVMSLPKTTSTEGFVITHNATPNGDFASSGLVSEYTLVMDLLWPTASNDKWRALLQTSAAN
ncbi:MAG: metallophosphoesterase [Deltaproteobacteria bacterium]